MGVEPLDYQNFEVDAMGVESQSTNETTTDHLSSSSSSGNTSYGNTTVSLSVPWSHLVSNLETSKEYYVRVSAKTDGVGYGEPGQAASNPVTPKGVPGMPGSVTTSRVDATTLMVEIEQDSDDNGAEVENYLIEWGTNSQFSGAQSTTLPPDYHIQAVRVDAWQRGWTSDAAFSLSLFDFKGAFSARLGGEDSDGLSTFVFIAEGTNTLNRTTPNVTAGFGSASLNKAVPRGGFVRVGGQEFRVCLDEKTLYGTDSVALCSVSDPYAPEYFVGASTQFDDTLTRAPAYVLDTAIGSAFRLAIGDTSLRTYNGPDTNLSVNDLTATLARGDYLRIGHPEEGRVFTVCEADGTSSLHFNSTYLPLCSGDDPQQRVSVMEGDVISATYEIQAFSLWLNLSAATANETDSFGFRLKFGEETSAYSETGGDAGCLSFHSSASQVRTAFVKYVWVVLGLCFSIQWTLAYKRSPFQVQLEIIDRSHHQHSLSY